MYGVYLYFIFVIYNKMVNLYKDIPAYHNKEKWIINMVVDIAKWSTNKYEYNEKKMIFWIGSFYTS